VRLWLVGVSRRVERAAAGAAAAVKSDDVNKHTRRMQYHGTVRATAVIACLLQYHRMPATVIRSEFRAGGCRVAVSCGCPLLRAALVSAWLRLLFSNFWARASQPPPSHLLGQAEETSLTSSSNRSSSRTRLSFSPTATSTSQNFPLARPMA
jgi:hypothetical protein